MSKNEKLLIVITTLFIFADAMSAVFMNVFLYSYTGSLVVMSIYTICRIALFPFSEWVAGKIAVKKSYAFTATLGLIGIMLKLAFVLNFNSYFALKPDLVYLVAIIQGIGEGTYYVSVNTLAQLVTTAETRIRYLTHAGIFNNIANVVAPLIASFIIEHSLSDLAGYINIFKTVLVVYFFIVLIAFRIKITKSRDFKLSKVLWSKSDRQWRYHQIHTALYGLRDSMILTLAGIMVYNATGQSGGLYGKLLALFALIAIISFRFVSKKMVRSNRMEFYKYGAFLISSSTIVLVLLPNIYGALYYGIVNALASPMYGNAYNIISMNIIQDYAEKENVVGRMIAKESALSCGRCSGMALIVLLHQLLDENLYLLVAVLILSLCPCLTYFYARAYHNKRDRANGKVFASAVKL